MSKIIYLDNGATTAVYPEVVKAMLPYFTEKYGNPSSRHYLGEIAQEAIINARKKIADFIGAKPWEIIFTSGGTESNNLALQGTANASKNKNRILISSIEHSSIKEPCDFLKSKGYNIREIPVDSSGIIDIDRLEKEINNKSLILSVMHANNEIGVIQDIKKIGELCRKKGVYFHTDAVQSFAKERINVVEMKIDMLSASAHKIGGPKGIGFLYVREGVSISPLIYGGGQERGMRGGTENVTGIIGFSKALEITSKIDKEKIRKLRDYFIEGLEKIGGKINGSKEKRLYNNIHVSFSGIDGEILSLSSSHKGILFSTKSACLTKQKKESRVLKAIGLSSKEAKGSIRIVLNEEITLKDINFVLQNIRKFIEDNLK